MAVAMATAMAVTAAVPVALWVWLWLQHLTSDLCKLTFYRVRGGAPDLAIMPALRLRRTLSQMLSVKTIDCGRPDQKMIEKATISYVKTDTKE